MTIKLSARLLLAAALLSAQQPPIRVSVTLVQVDAVVLDGEGRQVTNLTKDDFEVFDDGKQRAISHFHYERVGAPPCGVLPSAQPGAVKPRAALLRREDVHRTIALLVDDLKMSFESVHHTKEALKKFVNEQMQPGDLAAIVSTSGGISTLQQFTTDKKLLHAAIARIRFLLAGGGSGGSVKALGGGGQEIDPLAIAQVRQRRFTTGTLGALRHVVSGMKEMPGRKSIMLFSESLTISRDRKDETEIAAGEMLQIAERANGAAVVVYGIDPRGVAFPGIQAQDDTGSMEQEEVRQALHDRRVQIRESQRGLRLLAAETGGRVHTDNNDLSDGLRRMLEEQSGYYVLGFERGDDDRPTGTKAKYARLRVRVKRPGLRVHYRKGYMGGDNSSPGTPEENPAQRLASALRSPFAGRDIELRLTPGFGLTDNGQLAVQALVHIAGGNLAFQPSDAEGYRSAELHLVAVTEGEVPAEESTKQTYTIRVKSDVAEAAQQQGFVYELQHEVKQPGAYHLRVAVMDAHSGRIGSASRFVEVPNLPKGDLGMSSIAMIAGDWRRFVQKGSEPQQGINYALRTFRRQEPFSYGVTLYNAPIDKGGQLAVELHPFLMRDDKVVWQGKAIAVALQPGMDPRRIPVGGFLTFGANTPPGEYTLALKVISLASKSELLGQAVDFDLR